MPRFRPRGLSWPVLLVLAVAIAIVMGVGIDRWRGASAVVDPATIRAGFGPASYGEAIARADQDVAGAREGLSLAPGEWTHGEALALALLARWQLANDYVDLKEATGLLERGVADAPDPAGPMLAQAQLEITVHRLDRADAALARFGRSVVPLAAETASAAALAGDVALQRGNLSAASEKFVQAARIADSPGIGLRGAVLAFRRGERAAGKRALEALLAQPRQPPALLAGLALQRATMAYAEGDWDSAQSCTAAANRAFPGWWLGEAYAAQNEALAGHPNKAIRAYRAIAERTGRPEVMDALAHLLRLEGQGAASRAWAAKAAAGWESRAALFPEAVIQHRAEHELAVGSVAKALALAEADVAARPGAPGIALLARALILSGRPREALRWLDKPRDAGFVSAGMLMLRADALAALGQSEASNAARSAAEALNPRSADPRARLVWFGHD